MNFIKKQLKDTTSKENKNAVKILEGNVIAVVLTIIGLLIYYIIMASTDIGESTINYVVIGITAISILIGSIISVSKITKKGLLNGAIIGAIYVLVIYLLSSIVNSNFNINISTIILIIVSIVVGMIGGIIGVNIKK